jgi:hypothetical protein
MVISLSLYMLVGVFFFLAGSYMVGVKHMYVDNKAFRYAWILAALSIAWPIALITYLLLLAFGRGN